MGKAYGECKKHIRISIYHWGNMINVDFFRKYGALNDHNNCPKMPQNSLINKLKFYFKKLINIKSNRGFKSEFQ